jgi:multicomponent Na+:H+ antiporter subunit G
LGVVCVLLGVLILAPSLESAAILGLAILLQLLTTPFGSYALARAAHRSGSTLAATTHHDDLNRGSALHRDTLPP